MTRALHTAGREEADRLSLPVVLTDSTRRLNVALAGTSVIACVIPWVAYLFDPNANGGNGALVAQFAQLTGGDEVWCDPTTNRCFATGLTDAANANSRVVGVIDFNGAAPNLLQLIATSNGDHSVAVDPISGEVFVPTGGAVAGAVCPNGCILVFADVAVPEPASMTLMMTAFAGFVGLVWSRRRRQS